MQDILFAPGPLDAIRVHVLAGNGYGLFSVEDAQRIGRSIWSALLLCSLMIPDTANVLIATEILANLRDNGPPMYLSHKKLDSEEASSFAVSALVLMIDHMQVPMSSSLSGSLSAAIFAVNDPVKRKIDETFSLVDAESLAACFEFRFEHLL